ncbi:MAG: guanylate kinase [candidate division Zixibacteria bacterium]
MSRIVKKPGLVVILSSPSGTGKTSICHGLMKKNKGLRFSVSATTRPRRGKERDGIDYHFVTDKKFDSMVKKKEFAEKANVFGFKYGTPFSEIRRTMAGCEVLLCDVDVQGGMSLKRNYKEAVSIFVIPPSLTELKRRLYKRRTDSVEQMKLRLNTAVKEIGYWKKYDYVVVNDDLKKATEEVDKIIATERIKTTRRNERRYWKSSQARLLGL